MACTIKKVKHLFWYMVLVTVVVLIWSPQTMVKMVVASQHAPRDARENRRLRPSSYMKEEVNGGDEERRLNIDLNLPALPDNLFKVLKIDPEVGEKIEATIPEVGEKLEAKVPEVDENFEGWIPEVDEKIEATIPEVDENVKSLLKNTRLHEWANFPKDTTVEEYINAAIVKLTELVTKNGKETVASMLKAAKNDPATKQIAANLERILVLSHELNEDAFKMLSVGQADLRAFLASPLLKNYLELHLQLTGDFSLGPLVTMLLEHYSDAALAKKLLEVHSKDAAAEMAEEVSTYHTDHWENTYSGEILFERLGLKKAGIHMVDSPVWDTWTMYMAMRKGINKFAEPDLAEVAIPVLRKNFHDKVLLDWFNAAKTDAGVTRAGFLKTALDEARTAEGKAPLTISKRKGIDNELLVPTKRQRIDDGQ
ncbi:hypothetical protein DD237_006487 [Peronospora effusa]|uniref:Uncharacterized protein n=1 Tax=Peronospora effusa TaxID=542832 RepID=A0A425BXM7_9STRA|nr:hypothetical protein DD237_006487 [Peronospora effusa]